MRSKITNYILVFLSKNNVFINDDDKEIIKYGIESMYIMVTKIIMLLIVSMLIGIIKEFLIFFLTYGIIRTFSFGVHASKTWICNIISIIIFVFMPLLCLKVIIHKKFILIFEIVLSLIFILYSPADTANKPIVSYKRRLIYKFITLSTILIYMIVGYFISNNFISNCLFFSIVVQGIMILPITYRIFNQPYYNYRSFKDKEGLM